MLNLREYAEHKNVRSGKDYSGNDWGIVNKDNNFVRPDLLGEGTDWQDVMLRTAMTYKANATISGGSKNGSYSSSVSYLNKEGILRNTDHESYNIRLKSIILS